MDISNLPSVQIVEFLNMLMVPLAILMVVSLGMWVLNSRGTHHLGLAFTSMFLIFIVKSLQNDNPEKIQSMPEDKVKEAVSWLPEFFSNGYYQSVIIIGGLLIVGTIAYFKNRRHKIISVENALKREVKERKKYNAYLVDKVVVLQIPSELRNLISTVHKLFKHSGYTHKNSRKFYKEFLPRLHRIHGHQESIDELLEDSRQSDTVEDLGDIHESLATWIVEILNDEANNLETQIEVESEVMQTLIKYQ